MEIMSSKKTKTTSTSHVPNDIIIDILSWVPANSLLRLRWACKYWFHLITRDTSFTKLHLHTATNQDFSVLISKPLNPFCHPSSAPSCKIFQSYIDNSTTTTGSFSSRAAATNPILSGIFVDFHILGSCHGLILFSYYVGEGNETILCIWNPCTKEYKYLPKPPYWFDAYQTFRIVTGFGLGYDHSIEDYKVICNIKSLDGSIHGQVYTLRKNSWRYIGSITADMFNGFVGNGVFVNGALHFIYNDYPGERRILCLDFEKEMYVEISNQPECLNDPANSILGTLTTFEGSLCLTICTYTTSEAWVMKKDYNMNNNNNNSQEEYSWSKLYEIPYIHGIINQLLQPLTFTKNGEILLLNCGDYRAEGLILVDPKNNKLTIHQVYKLLNKVYKFPPIEQAATTVDINNKIEVVYIESLVSLNSGTYIDEKGDYMHYWQEDTNSGTYIDEIGDYMHYFFEDYMHYWQE